MANIVDWNSLGGDEQQGGGGSRGDKYLRFESGKMYTVRPVGRAFEFFKFFVKPTNKSVVVETEDVDAAAALLSEEFGMEFKPQHRYAINVIDREDNKIKIMEGGQMIFKQFALWAKGNNTHPGGMGGGDWLIQVTGDGLARKYNAQCIRPAPLSAEEVERVKNSGEVYDLETLYAGIALEKVVARAKGENINTEEPANAAQDLPQAPAQSQPQAQPQPQPAAAGAGINETDLW
jgi:hypothetical protein